MQLEMPLDRYLRWIPLPILITLAACSGNPSKEAPIESLGAKTAVATPQTLPENKPAPVVEMAKPPAPVSATESAQTRPLDGKDVQATPLQGAEGQSSKADASTRPAAVVAAEKGAPGATQPTAQAVTAPTERVIHFEYDSAALPATVQPLLERHAAWLRAHAADKVIIQGHTDERGSREYNLALGQKRAESVKQALGLIGVSDAQMEAVSLGEEKPLAEGANEDSWRQNRRAEIHYQGE
jgi:peptidoglycan-associated lipoprotein